MVTDIAYWHFVTIGKPMHSLCVTLATGVLLCAIVRNSRCVTMVMKSIMNVAYVNFRNYRSVTMVTKVTSVICYIV